MSERSQRRTYSHFAPRTSPPSEYEIVSTRLHYYVGRGFEVNLPLSHWYDRYQQASPLRCADWEPFADPAQLTYTSYTRSRKASEQALDRLFETAASGGADSRLARDWIGVSSAVVPPLRFAFHGFHMLASYLGQMAPSSRVTLAAVFQAGDELRRIERIAYRMRALQDSFAGFGGDSRADWQQATAWQPLRECVERLLVTYDLGESFVGFNLCLKPLVDEVVTRQLADAAARRDDAVLAGMLESFHADCVWQREWSAALARMLVAHVHENRAVVAAWLRTWQPRALRAAAALAGSFMDRAQSEQLLWAFHRDYLHSADLPADVQAVAE